MFWVIFWNYFSFYIFNFSIIWVFFIFIISCSFYSLLLSLNYIDLNCSAGNFSNLQTSLCGGFSGLTNSATVINTSTGNSNNIFLVADFYDSYSLYEESVWNNSHPHQIVYYEFVPFSSITVIEIVNSVFEIDSNYGSWRILTWPNVLYAVWLHVTRIWCPYSYLWFSVANLISCFIFFLTNEEELMNFDPVVGREILGVSFYLPANLSLLVPFYLIFLLLLNIFVSSLLSVVTEVHFELQVMYISTVWSDLQWRYGINLFIVSEVMVFFAFFWVFFHNSLSPSIEIADSWPPRGIQPLSWYHLPLLNTVILVVSGISVGWFNSVSKHFLYINMSEKGINNSTHNMVIFSFFVISDFLFVQEKVGFFESSVKDYSSPLNFILKYLPSNNLFYFYFNVLFYSVFLSFNFWLVNFLVLFFRISRYDKSVQFYLSFDLFNFKRSVSDTIYVMSYRNNLFFVWDMLLSVLSIALNLLLNYFVAFSSIINFFYNVFFFTIDSEILFKSHIQLALTDLYTSMILTLYLGYYFLGLQFCEYNYFALFNMNNIFGTVFYFLTCLHGLHVFIGLLMLGLCYTSLDNISISSSDSWFYDIDNSFLYFSVSYWHFVDVVWVILYITLYMWGSWTDWFSLEVLPPWI